MHDKATYLWIYIILAYLEAAGSMLSETLKMIERFKFLFVV
jgi:hypothetical protein